MSSTRTLVENDLAAPVVSLFPSPSFECFEQVPLARKRIDLVFVQRRKPLTISVELKIENWRKALWQATVNFQVSQESYIALWHRYIHRAEKQMDVLRAYGVGLIVVEYDIARIVLPSTEPVRRIPARRKEAWYRSLLSNNSEV
jgi:hypothetical protein